MSPRRPASPARAHGPRDDVVVHAKGMEKIRLRVSIALNRNHALTVKDLEALKPVVERGIAACLPGSLAVDTITVTKIREAAADASEKKGDV